MSTLIDICSGLPIKSLPPPVKFRDNSVPHAPTRNINLNREEKKLALKNALRYFPTELHNTLASEFLEELQNYGHIYMYRFRPSIEMRAYHIDEYPAKCRKAAAIMLMIMNNLDPKVAQFPHELVTYGGNGQVFSNWAQFWLVMHYLSIMTEDQTLVMYSGHPLGLFPSFTSSPRLVITNGMVIPNYSSPENYDRMFALGVTIYGQMTAGSYCYIGPQGIVHGTTLTIINAGRKYLQLDNLNGKVYLSSGLGGMSGAQAKAAVISGCIGVIAEISYEAIKKRYDQGWLLEIITDLDKLVERIREAKKNKEVTSIGYHGNIVDVWERMAYELDKTGENLINLGSDQTSCHNPYNGGYYPVQLSFEDAQDLISSNPSKFKTLVQESLKRQIAAINKLTSCGTFFWDYGNAFLLEVYRAGGNVGFQETATCVKFKYPSYVQDIMGNIFSLGFGPFRWICTSCDPEDLKVTDSIAYDILKAILQKEKRKEVKQQLEDNMQWISEAGKHNLVVGSQARILYSDQKGRIEIALAFNNAIKCGKIKAPIVLSRDHHDVSGTDSPFRETSNIYDGSSFTADMAVQNCIGDSFRGATWVALHNGGGVGWGEVINGGFGLMLDGTDDLAKKAHMMLSWDVSNGIARRSWSGNIDAKNTILSIMNENPKLQVTLPFEVDHSILNNV